MTRWRSVKVREAVTKAEAKWMTAIVRIGCIACRVMGHDGVPGLVHHLLSDGKRRRGHLFTICLCWLHHQAGVCDDEIVSRHPWKKKFEQRYGSEAKLLRMTKKLVRELS